MAVWGPVDPSKKHDIHGTYVTVDFNICFVDGACLEDCPVDVFTRVDTSGHPESDIKTESTHRGQYIDYMLCVDVYPADTINADPGRAGRI